MKPLLAALTLLASHLTSVSAAEPPRVAIVVGPDAPALDRLAAEEVAEHLTRLFDAKVDTVATPPDGAANVILVGSPETNPAVRAAVRNALPMPTVQGHRLKTVRLNDRPALLVGGGSPVATFWAASELGHRLGIRTLLYENVPPVDKPEWSLDGFDVVLEPAFPQRGWTLMDATACGPAAWGLADQKRLLRQLARLKFNLIVLEVRSWQAFLPPTVAGVKRGSASLWPEGAIKVDGDTAGRAAFRGAREFDNPELLGKTSLEDRTTASVALLDGIIDEAHRLGMTVDVSLVPHEFPKEAAGALARNVPSPDYPGVAIVVDDSAPRVEPLAEASRLEAAYRMALSTSLTSKADYFSPDFARMRAIRSVRPPKPGPVRVSWNIVKLALGGDAAGVLPQCSMSAIADALPVIRKRFPVGYVVHARASSGLDPSALFLARASFDAELTPEASLRDLVNHVSGEGMADRVVKAFELIEDATNRIEENDRRFAFPSADMLTKHGENGPVPDWWGKVRSNYLEAMNEMYRANTRAREGARPFTLYYARRFESAFEYMNAVEAVRNAAIAKAAGDDEKRTAQIEKAIESLYTSLNAYAAVARDPGDRGVIAILNEHGYRRLQRELE